MRQSTSFRFLCVGQAAALGLAAVTLVLACSRPAPAAPLAPDPVEALKVALRPERLIETAGLNEILKYRERTLRERVKALRTISDLGRALLLPEWTDEAQDPKLRVVDATIRTELADRFKAEVRAALQQANPLLRRSTVAYLGELATTARGTGSSAPKGTFVVNQIADLAPDVVRLAADTDERVREEAARTLGLIGADPEVSAPGLDKLLAADALGARRAAAESLRNFMAELAPGDRHFRTGAVGPAPTEVVRTGRAVLAAAARHLSDPDPIVRRALVGAFEETASALGDLVSIPSASRTLPPPGRPLSPREVKDLQDTAAAVTKEREQLEPLLVVLRDQAPALARLANDRDADTRRLVQQTFESMGYTRRRLLRRADSAPMPVMAGGNMVIPENRPAVKLPQDPLLEGLQRVLPTLTAGVSDPIGAVRLAAIEALEMLEDEARPAAPAVAKALGDADHFVRWTAARLCSKMDPAGVFDLALPGLVRLLGDDDLDVKLAAVTVFDRYGPAAKAGVPALARAVSTGDPEFRVAALAALQSVGTEAQSAIPAIAGAVADPDARVRRAAADVLGRFGPLAREAVPALRRALNDPEVDVRRAAEEALLSILRQ